MLNVSSVNLFGRIPQLGLPSLISDYLLFGVSFDDICFESCSYQGRPSIMINGMRCIFVDCQN